MSRRSPFESSQFGKSLSKQAAQEQIPVMSQAEGAFSGDTHLQGIPTTDKKSRDRGWEQDNRSMLFRGIPVVIKNTIKEIAADLQVRADDVGRAFLEYGLLCHGRGEIQFTPVLSDQRRTLFPRSKSGWGKSALPGWYEKIWDNQPPARKQSKRSSKSQGKGEKSWQQQVSYRGIPEDTQEAIRALHRQCQVPLGEVATMLLGHSLEAYQTGKLVLNPQPRQEAALTFSAE